MTGGQSHQVIWTSLGPGEWAGAVSGSVCDGKVCLGSMVFWITCHGAIVNVSSIGCPMVGQWVIRWYGTLIGT